MGFLNKYPLFCRKLFKRGSNGCYITSFVEIIANHTVKINRSHPVDKRIMVYEQDNEAQITQNTCPFQDAKEKIMRNGKRNAK